MSSQLIQLLPKSDGWLAYWQLFVASMAIFNTAQNFTTLTLTRRIYNNVPPATVTPLQARTFGVWTLTSAIVRFYAAYHINQKEIYDMAMLTYLIAFGHFFSEYQLYRTANVGAGLAGPMIVSTITMFWMFTQYGFYKQDPTPLREGSDRKIRGGAWTKHRARRQGSLVVGIATEIFAICALI